MKNRGIALSFNWIFAILVGGFILFLAIYGAGKFIRTSEQAICTETAASLVGLTDPLETGFASGKSHEIGFKKKSKLFFDCDENFRVLGRQRISFAEQTFGDKYGEKGNWITIKDKYLFVEREIEANKIYLFSKPFFMPYKVSDLIVIIPESQNYCFHDASENVRESLEGLNLKNIIFKNRTNECEGVDICFSRKAGCEIEISEAQGTVFKKKEGKKVHYVGNLLYGAIFSSPEIYECNVKRTKRRIDELAKIYLEKIEIVERQNCQSNIRIKLERVIGNIESSRELINLYSFMSDVNSINRLSDCKLYDDRGFE